MIIRFEDLVSNPEKLCREICAFIGEEFDPVMLTMEGANRYKNSGGNSSFEKIAPGSISTKPVGRYKQVLSGSEILFIQLFTRNIMQEFGYSLDKISLPPKEKLKYYLWILPSHVVRMVGWRVLTLVFSKKRSRVPESRFDQQKLNHSISN